MLFFEISTSVSLWKEPFSACVKTDANSLNCTITRSQIFVLLSLQHFNAVFRNSSSKTISFIKECGGSQVGLQVGTAGRCRIHSIIQAFRYT
uniref:Secreted protein n=1 Tax=Mesocestoides corti TaxID=53468 RepID=A0A5K3EYJ2_MESCO